MINLWISNIYKYFHAKISLRFIKYIAVGIIGLVINYGALYGFIALGIPESIALILAIECSLVHNYVLNHFWTFGHSSFFQDLGKRFLKYQLGSMIGSSLHYLAALFLCQYLPLWLANFIGVTIATFCNYAYHTRVTWKAKHIESIDITEET